MPIESVDGRDYEIEKPIVDIDGQQFATGLWVPHERDVMDRPLMASLSEIGLRDLKDVREAIDHPNRTPASVRFPAKEWTRSQGNVGSCAGYAGAWTLARARVLAGMKPVFLSGESLYAQVNRGRDSGSGLENNIKAMISTGVAPEGLNQAGRFYTESSLPEAAKRERPRFRALEYHQVSTPLELAIAIAAGFVTCVAIHVGGAWRRLDGDVLVGNDGVGNHAVLVDDVRFKGDRLQFRMVNSHGLSWGRDGVAWTEWDRHYRTTVRHHLFYAIRAVLADPQESNPPVLAA